MTENSLISDGQSYWQIEQEKLVKTLSPPDPSPEWNGIIFLRFTNGIMPAILGRNMLASPKGGGTPFNK